MLPGWHFLQAAWKSLPNRFDPRLPEPLPPPTPAFNCSGCWEISRLNLSNSNFQPGDRVLPLSARLEAPSPSQHQHCQVPLHLLPQPSTVLPPPPAHRFIFSHYCYDPCILHTITVCPPCPLARPRTSQQKPHGVTRQDRGMPNCLRGMNWHLPVPILPEATGPVPAAGAHLRVRASLGFLRAVRIPELFVPGRAAAGRGGFMVGPHSETQNPPEAA